jgi:hypothetical protein
MLSPEWSRNASGQATLTLSWYGALGARTTTLPARNDIAVVDAKAKELGASVWSCNPNLSGPFTSAPSSAAFSCSATATTRAFDPNVSSDVGNEWAALENVPGSVTPLRLGPGETGTIHVNFATDASVKSTAGSLFLETFNGSTVSADVFAILNYSYQVK